MNVDSASTYINSFDKVPSNIFERLSSKAREILKEAKELLAQKTDLSPTEFYSRGAKAHQPLNSEIARLATLRKEACANFNDLLIKHENDSWNHSEVISAFFTDIKIAFALDVLMLIENGGNAKELTDQHSYQCGLFFVLPESYHNGRAGAYFKV